MVIGEKPTAPIGLSASDQDAQKFQQLADRLWNGKIIQSTGVRDVLEKRSIGPDFEFASADDETQLDYFHRRTNDADIYFVANLRDVEMTADCSFRVSGRRPELWDPLHGSVTATRAFRQEDGRTVVPLRLPPNGSLFVVFRDELRDNQPGDATTNFADTTLLEEIAGPWNVSFDPRWGGPAEIKFDTLTDWSLSDDPRVRYYSGTAVYSKSFEMPASLQERARYWLDLGEVKNLARLHVNGVDWGVMWTHPFRLDITSAVKPGTNQVKMEVVNLWPNRLIGVAKLPADQRVTKTNITKFSGDQPLLRSGLLGPVRLLVEDELPRTTSDAAQVSARQQPAPTATARPGKPTPAEQ